MIYTRRLTVLLVEDNPGDARIIWEMLTDAASNPLGPPEWALITADRLEIGQARLSEGEIDVVLLDLGLPDSQGLETFAAVYTHAPHVPIVVLSSLDDENLALEAVRQGAQDYLVKGQVSARSLAHVLRYAIERHQMLMLLQQRTEALQASEERIRGLIHSIDGIVWEAKIDPLQFTFVSQQAERLLGYPLRRWLTEPTFWQDCIHADDRERVIALCAQATAEGRDHELEYRMIAADDRIVWLRDIITVVMEGGQPVRLRGVMVDITQRKQAEERIRRQASITATLVRTAERLNSLLDLDHLLRVICEEAAYAVNASLVTVYLYDEDQQIWRYAAGWGFPASWEAHWPPIPKEFYEELYHRAQHFGSVLVIPDVQTVPQLPYSEFLAALNIRTDVSAIIQRKGRLIGALNVATIGQVRHFTEEELSLLDGLANQAALAISNARLYISLQSANEELQTALQAKEEMIQNVSHELRTPLTMIRGYTEMWQRDLLGTLPAEQVDIVEILHSNAERLQFMVDRLLRMQTLDPKSFQKSEFDPAIWLRDVAKSWHEKAKERGIQLYLELPASLPTIRGDLVLLNEVIDNLLDNAFKFSPSGGEICIRAWQEGTELIIAVSDQGVGIPSDKLERIFERFYQVNGGLNREFGGMGIGLALCKKILEGHNGRIWAASEGEGNGSTFHIALPAVASRKKQQDATIRASQTRD
ncbi:MAG TPA: PAS domain-containing protein [Caldilineae bacterium]|nr:PAS domain-containing protein [Caldilineae bacterium]